MRFPWSGKIPLCETISAIMPDYRPKIVPYGYFSLQCCMKRDIMPRIRRIPVFFSR